MTVVEAHVVPASPRDEARTSPDWTLQILDIRFAECMVLQALDFKESARTGLRLPSPNSPDLPPRAPRSTRGVAGHEK